MTATSLFKLGLWPFLALNAVVAIGVIATHDSHHHFIQQVGLWLVLTPLFAITLIARLRDIGISFSWAWALLATLLTLCFLVEQPFAGSMGLMIWAFAAMTPSAAYAEQTAQGH